MPLIQPETKHIYTATVELTVDEPDPVRAFQLATELVKIGWPAHGFYKGANVSAVKILNATVERHEPLPIGGGE